MRDSGGVFTVTDNERGQRLDRFLQTQMPERSRAFLQKLIEQGNARVNGQPHKASYSVRTGDQVSVEIRRRCRWKRSRNKSG